MNIKHYTVNNCRLYEAKKIIELTGIKVTNASVVTRMLERYCPHAQTAKEWRDAGADIPSHIRDNKRMMTEQQVDRYLSNIPYKDCPDLQDMFKEVKEYFDDGDRSFECVGIAYEYDTDHRRMMTELHTNYEFLTKLDTAMDCPGMIVDFPIEVETTHRNVPEWKYITKFEVPFFDSVKGVAHFYITNEQMTQWQGAHYYGQGTVELKSKEYEELKKRALAVAMKLGCEYHIHILHIEDAKPVTLRDGSYYFEAELRSDEVPF